MNDVLGPPDPLWRQADANLPDKVYTQLLRGILSGKFPASGKLPPEHLLAKRFDVSRPTVREAISRLRSDGVVTSRRGAGNFVLRMPSSATDRRYTIESIADIDRYFAFRMCVEAGAAGHAAEMRTEADLQEIRASLNQLTETIDVGGAGVEHDVKFHLAVARASHNQFFVTAMEDSVGPIRQCIELARSLAARTSPEQGRRLHGEHTAIVDAIARQAASDAAEAMRRHIVQARRRIFMGPGD